MKGGVLFCQGFHRNCENGENISDDIPREVKIQRLSKVWCDILREHRRLFLNSKCLPNFSYWPVWTLLPFEARAPSDPLLLKKKILWIIRISKPFQNPNGGLYWSFKGPCLSSLWTEDQRAPAQTLYKKFPGKNILGEILFALPFPSPPPPRAKRQ